MDELLDPSEPPQWGIRLNAHKDWYVPRESLTEGCPAWASSRQQEEWRREGLVVWNKTAHTVEALRPWEGPALLDRLRASEMSKAEGGAIEKCLNWNYLDGTFAKSKRHAADQASASASQPTASRPRRKENYREIVRLNPPACQAVVQFLQSHEAVLLDMAQAEEDRAYDAIRDVTRQMLRWHRNRELEELQPAQRKLPWTHLSGKTDIVCDMPPNRATVTLTEDALPMWQACIERPHRFKHDSPAFYQLIEALDWAEKELAAEPTDPEPAEAQTFPCSTMDLHPYEIDPATLEPPRVTYRSFIELQREPIRFKQYEMSFGEIFQYDREYPSPSQLAGELSLHAERVDIQEIVEETGLYRILSLTSFYSEALAITQTQQLWDRSDIVQQYQAKKVAWAYYGYQEAETDYTVLLGGCESLDHPPPQPVSRAEHLAGEARRLTLIHALDVVGFRAYLRVSNKWLSDAQLLRSMHEERARSQFVPVRAREESRRWLREHPGSPE